MMDTQPLDDLEAVTLSYVSKLKALTDAILTKAENGSTAWYLMAVAREVAEEAEMELVEDFHRARAALKRTSGTRRHGEE